MESLSTLFPTDNLYKFLALTGLLLFAFFLVYPDIKLYELDQKQISANGDMQILNEEILSLANKTKKNNIELREQLRYLNLENYILEKLNNISVKKKNDTIDMTQQIKDAHQRIEKLKDRNEREYFEFVMKYRNDIYPKIKEVIELDKAQDEYNKILELQRLKQIKLKTTQSRIDREKSQIEYIQSVQFFGMLIGGVISILGFSSWYFIYQKRQDELIKLQLDEFRQKFSNNEPKIIIGK